jgi:FAD binding domain
VLVSTRRLDAVHVDPLTHLATIGAGVQWGAVVAAAAPFGLAPVTGSSPGVGVVGYLTGGGVGPLARSHGFSSDWVRGYRVVTGAGELVGATAQEHPDLYWALRGGKTGLGIVTEVEVELAELATLYGGNLTYATPDIEKVLRDWIDFTSIAPEGVTTSVVIVRTPDLPQVPEPVRGKTLLTLRFAYPGTEADGEAIAQRFRDVAPVFLDRLGQIPASAIGSVHDDPTEPGPSWVTGGLLDDIDQDFATIVLTHVGAGVDTVLMVVELRHLGGATATDVAGGSAVSGRAATHTIGVVAMLHPGLPESRIEAAARELFADIAPWASAQANPNFANTLATAEQAQNGWPDGTLDRLREVRSRYDPAGVFA